MHSFKLFSFIQNLQNLGKTNWKLQQTRKSQIHTSLKKNNPISYHTYGGKIGKKIRNGSFDDRTLELQLPLKLYDGRFPERTSKTSQLSRNIQDLLIQAHARQYLQSCEVRSCLTLKLNQKDNKRYMATFWCLNWSASGLQDTRVPEKTQGVKKKTCSRLYCSTHSGHSQVWHCQKLWGLHHHGCRAGENLPCVCTAIYIICVQLDLCHFGTHQFQGALYLTRKFRL